jgi:solute:Na+ symporter, SSS family
MNIIDWLVLCLTIAGIIIYGIYKSRNTKSIETFLLADRQLPWYHVGLSVMATQASAITFLSAPGQGFSDGLRFIQFYFGLPLAMIVLCVTFVPMFSKLNVYTAYEFIEKRFDHRARYLTAFLFLLQRGLSTGISIYAPAIILSTILQININYTILLTGLLVITYTVYGGAKAVSYTQLIQMMVIFGSLFLAAYLCIHLLPQHVSFGKALQVAGKCGHMNAIDTKLDWNNKYNLWSGLIGGFFLQLSYFGTDQSQVGRYLTGSSVTQSRLGLVMNALIKIPMQFLILMIGVLVFVFYQFNKQPVFYNEAEVKRIEQSVYADSFNVLSKQYNQQLEDKKVYINKYLTATDNNDKQNYQVNFQALQQNADSTRKQITSLMKLNNKAADVNDSNYVFLYFLTHHFPRGVIGLLIAIIFLASMGSIASGLNSLASTTVVDFYKGAFKRKGTQKAELNISRWSTIGWGLFCIGAAFFASKMGNLIEAVNILGSLFYGVILGIFIVAFYLKWVQSTAVFIAALIAQVLVIIIWRYDVMAFLWLNVIGCLLVVVFSIILQLFMGKEASKQEQVTT